MNAIICVNKEKNVTSRDVVNDIVHIFHTKKVGHTGTLDPIATGVLVVTIGRYTKLNELLTSTYKEYVATMQLGIETDTLDNTGKVINTKKEIPVEEDIRKVIESFKKSYEQEVPAYSAVKINGRKLYDYARNNEIIELPKRNVEIKEIEILSINKNIIKFRCLVSKGTYIRSLIRDIAYELNNYGIMTDLARTKQGIFNIEDSYTIEDIKEGKYNSIQLDKVLDLEKIELNNEELYKKVFNGNKLEEHYNKEYILFTKDNNEIALYKKENNEYHMYLKIAQ